MKTANDNRRAANEKISCAHDPSKRFTAAHLLSFRVNLAFTLYAYLKSVITECQ